jgi:hypothetical protein
MVARTRLGITLYAHYPSYHHLLYLSLWKKEQTCIFCTLLRLICHILEADRGDAQCRDQVIDAQASPPWPYIFKDFSVNHMGLSGFDLSNTWVVALSYTWIMDTRLYPRVAVFRKTFEQPILHARNRPLGRYSQIINSVRTLNPWPLKKKEK